MQTDSNPILAIDKPEDIPERFQGTAISKLFGYHNFGNPDETYESAELLIATCMDNRVRIRTPKNFAFTMRAAGANFAGSTFPMAFAAAAGGAQAIALVGHTLCGMGSLEPQRQTVLTGMVQKLGWSTERAEAHFEDAKTRFEIGDPIAFTRAHAAELQEECGNLPVAALLYRVEDHRLYLLSDR